MTLNNTQKDSANSNKKGRSKDGLRAVFLGVPGRPFPILDFIMEATSDGDTIAKKEWRVYDKKAKSSTNQVAIFSERSDEEVLGMLYRNLPKPSMLKIFWDGSVNRMPESRRRLEFVKGYPGAGKTFMAKLHASLRTDRKPITIDCGGRNLQELLWETVIDFGADEKFYEQLDIRGAAGELHEVSKKILREALGEAYHEDEETGRVVFLWDRLGNADSVKGRPDNYMDKVKEALTTVRRFEGLESSESSALGLKMVPGVIFQAFQQNVPLILDEYNKSKEGTDDAMQTVLQFINGEIDEVTIHSPMKDNSEGGQSYTLRREDMGDLFFVTATGNAVVDGVSTRPLSESANQRWQPVTIPNSTLEDWEHAWTQFTTGVPISTLYQMGLKDGVNQWDENPAKFKNFLLDVLTKGRSETEVAALNEEYFDFINHWKPVLEDLKKISGFCHAWTSLLDPHNIDYDNVSNDGVLEEIEEPEYREEVAMGYRKILKWLEEVRKNIPEAVSRDRAQGVDTDSFFKDYDFAEEYKEPIALNYGDRLREVIKREITRTTQALGKKHTFNHLKQIGKRFGVIADSVDEGRGHNRLFGAAMNISPLRGYDIETQAEILQKHLSDYIRKEMPDRASKTDEELVPLTRMKSLVQHLMTMDMLEADKDNPNAADILFINDDPTSAARRPVGDGRTLDMTPVKDEDGDDAAVHRTNDDYHDLPNPPAPARKEPVSPSANDLVSEKNFLNTLVLPVIGEMNLRTVWNKALTNSGLVAEADEDRSLKMAEARDRSGLAITTVMVSNDAGQESPVHLIKNSRTGQVLVIGDMEDEDLSRNFVLARMNYVSRKDADAEKKIRTALHDIAGDAAKEIDHSLKMAFLMRNQHLKGNEAEKEARLSALLAANDVECLHKHYLTKKGGRLLKARAG